MTTRHGKAAILGGGIGGLTVANALVRRGWHVDVFERSPSLPDTGTALGMWAEALDALTTAGCGSGLGGQVEKLGVLQDGAAFLRWDGRVIGRIRSMTRPVVLFSRPKLLTILAEGLPSDLVRFGAPAPELPDLAAYDVVVAADGINSTTRDRLFGPAFRPVYTGYSAWRGWVPGTASTTSESWGPGALFGITPRDGDLTNWFAAVRAPAGGTGNIDELRERYRDWHPAVRDVLDRIDPADVLHHDLYESPPLPSFVHGNVALLGDAAHAMAPNLGRGACEAMIDGATLAVLLAEHPVAEALERYDRVRRRRTQRLVRASRTLARVATARRFTTLRDPLVGAAAKFAR
ncbi:aromatic ring hydroxylase [Rhodococcus rhodochrous]|uniref:FAD-dependent monooxygenase n=1 Tax=Rhodococcus rhodochrous TaxID=1829 RepID=UPI000D04B1F9|nr:FAD-dependent monooxygenase [Rhodococcus rhodochrous]AYA24592.1 aromatic ring hydroxylase [Rhodococcus rhodochrous]